MYRDSFDKCPRCGVALVDARSARGCRECGGLWVDEGVLTEMILEMLPPRPLSRLALAVLDRAEAPMACPSCSERMEAVALHGVPLDRCAKHGIWFDARELEETLRRVAEPDRPPPFEPVAAEAAPTPWQSMLRPEAPRAVPWPTPPPPPVGNVLLVFEIYAPGRPPRELRVQQPIVKLGRLAHAHVVIDDERASRLHAVIEATSLTDVSIIDLGSATGTRVNGAPINKQQLRSGDVIHIGETSLHLAIAAG